jgi:hypothetical protein
MKKVILMSALLSLAMMSCKKDDTAPETTTIPANTLLTAGTYFTSVGTTGTPIEGKFVGDIVKTANHKGVANAAWQLDGINDYIEIADDAKFKPAALTFAIRAYTEDTKGSNGIIFKSNGQTAYDEAYGLFATGAGKFAGVAANNSTEPVPTATTTYQLNKWYHLAVSADSDSIRLYVDGIKQQTLATKFNLKHSTLPLLLGRYPYANTFFKGKVTDFVFYNKVLTDAEILNISK